MADSPPEVALALELLAPICRKHGIRRLVMSGIEIELEPRRDPVTPEAMALFQKQIEGSMPSDDEILYHSAPGMVVPEGDA